MNCKMDPVKAKQDREIIKPKFLSKLKKLENVTKPTQYILEVLVNGFSVLAKLKKRSDLFDDILLKWLIVLKNCMGQLDKDLIYSFSNGIIVNFLNILIIPKLEVKYMEDLICFWEDIIIFFSADVIKRAVIENMTLFQEIVKNMQNFGHFFHQLCCFIVLSKCINSCQNKKQDILEMLFPEEKYYDCVTIMTEFNFEAIDFNSRKFINSFNENQETITVYSLISSKINLDEITLFPPKIENSSIEQWVDFNMGASSIFFQCDVSPFDKRKNHSWIKFEIKPDNLEKIYLNEKNGFINLEILIIGSFCLEEDYKQLFADIKTVQFLFSGEKINFTKLQNIMKEYLTKFDKFSLLTIGIDSQASTAKFCVPLNNKYIKSKFEQAIIDTENIEPIAKKCRMKKEIKKKSTQLKEKSSSLNITNEIFGSIQNKLSLLNPNIVDTQIFTNSCNSKYQKIGLPLNYKHTKSKFEQAIIDSDKENNIEPISTKFRMKKTIKKKSRKLKEKTSSLNCTNEILGNIQNKLSLLNPSIVDAQLFTDSCNSQEYSDYFAQRLITDKTCFENPTQGIQIECGKHNKILNSSASQPLSINNFSKELGSNYTGSISYNHLFISQERQALLENLEDKSYAETTNNLYNDKDKLDICSSDSDYKLVTSSKPIDESVHSLQNFQNDLPSHSDAKDNLNNIEKTDEINIANNKDSQNKIINYSPDCQTTITKLINRVKPLQNINNEKNMDETDIISEMDSLEYLQTKPYFDNQEQLEQAFDLYIKNKQNPNLPVNNAKINLIDEMIDETSQFFKTNNNNKLKDVYDISNEWTNNKNDNKKNENRLKKTSTENKNLINFSYRRSTKSNIENISINSKNAIVHMKINTKEKTSARTVTRQNKSNVSKTKKINSKENSNMSFQGKKPKKICSPEIEVARHEANNNNLKEYNDVECMFDAVFNMNVENSKEADKEPKKYNKSKRLTKTYHKNATPTVLLSKVIIPGETLDKPKILSDHIYDQDLPVDIGVVTKKDVIDKDCKNECIISKPVTRDKGNPSDSKWILNKFFSNLSDYEDNNKKEVHNNSHSINSLGSSPIRAGQHSLTNYTETNFDNNNSPKQANSNISIESTMESIKPECNINRKRPFIINENNYTLHTNNNNNSTNVTDFSIENFISSEYKVVPYDSRIKNQNSNYNGNLSIICNNTRNDSIIKINSEPLIKHKNKTASNNHSNESILITNLKMDFENMFVSYSNEKSDAYFDKTENMIEMMNKNIKNVFEKYFIKMNETQNKVEKQKIIIHNLYEQLSNEQSNYAELIRDSIQCKNDLAKHLRAVKRMKTEIITIEKTDCYVLEKDVIGKREELKKLLWQIFITNVADEMKNYIMCFL